MSICLKVQIGSASLLCVFRAFFAIVSAQFRQDTTPADT